MANIPIFQLAALGNNLLNPVRLSEFQLSNEISPILLVDGIAKSFPDSAMPITVLTEPGGERGFTYHDYFAHFKNLPTGTLSEWQIAEYPFASMVMAANAVVQMPLHISMLMICPAQNTPDNNYISKTSRITALQNQIQAHITLGGSFIVVTPAYTYNNVLLKQIRDVTPAGDIQVQSAYQWDFEQPLITASGAQQVLGNFLTKAQNGFPTTTTWNAK